MALGTEGDVTTTNIYTAEERIERERLKEIYEDDLRGFYNDEDEKEGFINHLVELHLERDELLRRVNKTFSSVIVFLLLAGGALIGFLISHSILGGK